MNSDEKNRGGSEEDLNVDQVCRSVDLIIADEAPDFSFRSPHHSSHAKPSIHYKGRRREKRKPCVHKDYNHHNSLAYVQGSGSGGGIEQTICRVWMISLALMIPFTLILCSGQVEDFAMAPLQTRALHAPSMMTESLHIERMAFSPEDAGNFSVHQFDGPCPPLTGPVEVKSTTENMTLSQGEFVYRSLHLNRGSRLSVDATVLTGKAVIYLVAGALSFDEFRDYPQDYRYSAAAIAVREKTSDGVRVHLQYQVPSSDTFYLIYWNPKEKLMASVTSSIVVEMTTHILDGVGANGNPVCGNTSLCFIKTRMWHPQCTIIRADGGASLFEDDLNKFPILSIEVARFRRWRAICGLSIIPLLMVILYSDKVGPAQPNSKRRTWDVRIHQPKSDLRHLEGHPSELTYLCDLPTVPGASRASCGNCDEETAGTFTDSLSYDAIDIGDMSDTKRVKWAHPVRTIMTDPPLHQLSPTPRSA